MIKLAKLNDQPEIFHTIQGEGKNLGKPSIFIRLSLCNLYCIWCDTDYTWNWEKTKYPHLNDSRDGYQKFKKKDNIIKLSNDEIIKETLKYNCENIVITGGEPMVQKKDLTQLLFEFKQRSQTYHIEIETNGTLAPSKDLDALIDQYNVSIKLSNSHVEFKDRIVPKAIRFFANSPKSNFKFVINDQKDLTEVLKLKEDFNLHFSQIYLMPQGRTVDEINSKQLWLTDICKQYNFNYTDRLHIKIYGEKRGV